MYDGVVNSYIRGEIDKATCRQMMWVMGASQNEMYFYLEEADKQRANNASSRPASVDGSQNSSNQRGMSILDKLRGGSR